MDLLQEAGLGGDAEDELTFKKKKKTEKSKADPREKEGKSKSLVENQMKGSIWSTRDVLLNCTIVPWVHSVS